MKISIITWDASFRERFHTIDSFCSQDYSKGDFEFIWVDFYNNTNKELQNRIKAYPNAQLINLNNSPQEQWHLGKCINAGVKEAKGEILVFPDGDIIVQKNHLKVIEDELEKYRDLVLYFRRWDELKDSNSQDSYTETYLEKHTKLLNPTNYAGCFALHKSSFYSINGYEENKVFAGPGANGKETYLRLRNAGLAIKWHEKKIYHPWHPSTGSSDKYKEKLIELAKQYNWLKPYCGVEQSWVLKNRELDLSFKANDGTINNYLENLPNIDNTNNKKMKKIKRIFK